MSDEIPDQAQILTTATAALVSRVGALADAVQVNNHKIDKFSEELAKKPDDAEVQFISGLAKQERRKHLKWSIFSAVLSALVAGLVSFGFAKKQVDELTQNNYTGCVAQNKRVEVISKAFRDVVEGAPVNNPTAIKIRTSADNIDTTKRNCESLYSKAK